MKISELEKIMLEKTTKISLLRAKEILRRGDLTKININKVGDFYNIYCSYKCENKAKLYNSHLKINIKDGIITLGKCDCDVFLEYDSHNRIYLCEHLVATFLSFINQVKKKLNQGIVNKEILRKDKKLLNDLIEISVLSPNINSDEVDQKLKRKKLKLNISIKEVREDAKYFDLYLFIENESSYPINDIKEFILSIIKLSQYHIGKGLIYNPSEFYFSKEDMNIIDYFYEYILISNEKNIGERIRINREIARRFLEKCILKKIKFTYNYQSYVTEIKNEDLPLSFTLKDSTDEYILTTKTILPIPINEKMDVFFFDRKIYIPSDRQFKIYKPLYNVLKKSKKFVLGKDTNINSIINLISSINLIAENFFLDDKIVSMLENYIKINFDFQRKDNNYYCNVKIAYNNQEISYKEALASSNEIIKKSKRIKLIESELNKNRFYYKDGKFIFYGTDEEYYMFLKGKFEEIRKLGVVSILEDSTQYFKFHSLNFGACIVDNEDNSFNIKFKLDGFDNQSLNEIVTEYRNKKSYIKLKDNTYVDFENKELNSFMNIIEYLDLDVTKTNNMSGIHLYKINYLNDKLGNNNINFIGNNEKFLEIIKGLDEISEHQYEIPKDLKATLRKYQIKGFNWFKNLSYLGFGGILADEMGLGKTIQTITFLISETDKHTLIVAPTSLIYNWKEEFDKFAPKLKVGIVHGNKSERYEVLNRFDDFDILLTTFGTLKNDIIEYEKTQFDFFIIDEGQNINNPESQNSRFVKMIKSNNRFVLTGTPIENNLMELWALFDFVMPGYLYTKEKFATEFIKKENALEDLKNLISPYILRRTKRDVIKELPEKIEKKYLVEMTGPQKQIYIEFIKEIQNEIKNKNSNGGNIGIFAYLTKLRQICLDPSITFDNYFGGSGKINVAKDIIIEKIREHKILVFSQFTSVLTRFSNELRKENIKHSYLDGATPSKNRVKLVDEFNDNDNIRVFLISLKAGGTGLNLTSADVVIHFDPWWNLAAEDQATDRVHRIGQKHMVEVIKLIAKDTIEEKILLLQNDKKQLVEEVITGELEDENIINKLKNSEILSLFSG